MDLKGKVALVTGGAAGIGRAYCEELLKHGCKIGSRGTRVKKSCKNLYSTYGKLEDWLLTSKKVQLIQKQVSICDINSDAEEDLVHQLSNKYGKDRILFCQCDVTDYMQFEESFQTTISTFGGVDIVINNAGIMNDRFWELEVDVNLNGVIRGMLLAFRFMGRDRGGHGGVVVNTGSNVCVRPYVSVPIYTATKHAIVGLTRSYGAQYHVNLTGVKVLALCPSGTDTDLLKDVKKQLLSLDYENAWKHDTANSVPQKAEHVAKALIQILQKGASGSCWLVENSQPPKEIPPLVH